MPMFGIGGLTGLPLGLAATDIPLHDTNYVVGHFHYLVAPGTIFALFAGIYYWFPKITGRMMNETLGKIHFVGSLVCMNLIFMPMFVQGLAGVNRRLWDGGALYTHAQGTCSLNVPMSYAALALGVLPDLLHRQPVVEHRGADARRARTRGRRPRSSGRRRLRRRAHGNFDQAPRVVRDPYEYSVPGATADFSTGAAQRNALKTRPIQLSRACYLMRVSMAPAYHADPLHHRGPARHGTHQSEARDLAVPGVRGDAVRLAVLVLRAAAHRRADLAGSVGDRDVPLATLNTVVLIASSVTMVMAWASLKSGSLPKYRLYMGLTLLCGAHLPRRQGHRVQRQVLASAVSVNEQLPRRSTSR